jgi:hypothetical protein
VRTVSRQDILEVVTTKRSLSTVLCVAVLALLSLALATPAAAFGSSSDAWSFTDVTENTWCRDAVEYVYDRDLMKGVSPTTFAPAATLTRAMLATVIYRLDGQPEPTAVNSYSDVAEGSYYGKAAVWAAEKGLLSWSAESTFRPDNPATREQFVVALYRYAILKGYDVSIGEDTNILSYDDAFDISEGMASAFQWACGAGVVEGNGPRITPLGNATRGQTATMLMRFLQKVVK